jgi:hypothetical protein
MILAERARHFIFNSLWSGVSPVHDPCDYREIICTGRYYSELVHEMKFYSASSQPPAQQIDSLAQPL